MEPQSNYRKLVATPQDDRFATMTNQPWPGQWRQKVWRRLLGHPSDAERHEWAERALNYFTLQGLKYGLIMDVHGIRMHFDEHTPVVVASCLVVDIIPGKRVTAEQWRKENPPIKLSRQMGLVAH